MTHKEIKLVVKTVFSTLLALFVMWVLWSWYDVLAHQMSGGTQNELNFFLMCLGG